MSDVVVNKGVTLMCFYGPTVVVSCVCALFLTRHKLPSWRLTWIHKALSCLRRHPRIADDTEHDSRHGRWTWLYKILSSLRIPFPGRLVAEAEYGRALANKANQFGRGEPNFNAMAIWLAFLPMMVSVLAYMPPSLTWAAEDTETGENVMRLRVEYVSYTFGWVSTLCLAFFLIPVTRHSVLLAAMGWSPIHALRIHIWFGYLAFLFMFMHGVMLVPVWFIYYDYPVWQQIVPNRKCWTWTWTEETVEEVTPDCYHVFANWTGIVAAVFFTVLWGSSLNWVRRRNYRLFYILHVTFGTLTLLSTILHMYWVILTLVPSLTYYLTSTTPTLIQALASRFRGGVKIRQVVLVQDSGGCVEVQLEAHETVHSALNLEPCQYVKICVPKISLIWHPFDVYKSYDSNGNPDDTVRFLFRPVGPFTKKLAERLTSLNERPVTLVDGFYRRADNSELALQHDCVTMVAGGVAVSLYLTLIPALLRRLAGEGGKKTKTIVLHWVCREPGLCYFVVQTYLKSILKSARGLNEDVKVAVYVYLTGRKKIEEPLSEMDTLQSSSRMLNPPFNSKDVTVDETAAMDEESNGSEQNKTTSDGAADTTATVTETNPVGHSLELARMLPRRYASPIWNIPFFVAYSGASWFGFWYLFSQEPEAPMNYYSLSSMTWITLYSVLMYVAYGIAVEAFVLMFRKYWPQPTTDDFNIITNKGAMIEEENEDVAETDLDDFKIITNNKVAMIAEENPSKNVSLVYREGRPTQDQIFEDARIAVEPGIFVCGPASLTGMVKKEASKENSFLGLTRFCLYDEPYEM